MRDIDGDGDIDVSYIRGDTVYLKRHQGNKHDQNFITDRPRIYDQNKMYQRFMGIEGFGFFGVQPMSRFLDARSDLPDRLSAQVLDDQRNIHARIVLEENLFAQARNSSEPKDRTIFEILDRE